MTYTVTDLRLPSRVTDRIALGPEPADPARPVEGPCWVWTGGTYPSGYGRVWLAGESRGVHQVTFEAANGVRSDRAKFVDHVCRVRRCCNPAHLELVTPAGNQITAQRDHCKNGHPFDDQNTRRTAGRPNVRICRACGADKARRHRQKRSGS